MSTTENAVIYLRDPAEPRSVAHREVLLHLDPVTDVPIGGEPDLNPDGWDVITETEYLTAIADEQARQNVWPGGDPDDSEDD